MLLLVFFLQGKAQELHRLSFQTEEEMYAYFRYAPGKQIISGHRGTKEAGMPENSIPALEAVLKHTTAIFEVDPRLTKDSVPVMVHDQTLDRTTTGKGNVRDYTWAELQRFRLKDAQGRETPHPINTLDELIEWAKGKTILNLDKKDLPMELTARIIARHQAYAWVWVTVHNVEQARFYLKKSPKQFLSMHVRTAQALEELLQADLPFDRMIVYIGPEIVAANRMFYEALNRRGVMCMISTAPTYDKLDNPADRADKYRAVFADGASILESDLPIEVHQATAH